MTNYIRRRQQRGVILLAVVSLLTMFMLIGITYVVVSGHFKRAAVTNSRVRQLEVPPQKHLDGAMYQLLRDTDFAGSVVRGHSLLQDKYGHFTLRGTVEDVTYDFAKNEYPAKNQILKIKVDLDVPDLPLSLEPLSNPGALNGRVVTILDGTFKNFSGRILKSTRNNSKNFTLRILFPKTGSEHTSKLPVTPETFLKKQILINGRDFSGTGFGLDMRKNGYSSGTINISALLPNRAADTKDEFNTFRQGGANEGYDVPDYQNMAMAALLSDPTSRELQYIIPSFHRPALINYWKQRGAIPAKVMMRPRKEDHPSFTGSNPRYPFDPILGPWDVDNDGDGIRDSIWIDMGFPIQTDSSGRRYKPLFAVLCLDMDGRLNLNAHGNKKHYEIDNKIRLGRAFNIRRGMGYGPAEIKLTDLFRSSPPLIDEDMSLIDNYRKLLMGDGATLGRYGRDGSPGYAGIDRFSYYIFGHFPNNFVFGQNTSFQSMPDIHGELGYNIDLTGNVVSEVSIDLKAKPRSNTIADNPYEANLVSPNAADQLFSALEMETLLRYHDPDNPQFNNSSPPQPSSWKDGSSRLYRLTNAFNGSTKNASANRRSVTTASFDPPVPAVQIPAGLRYDPDPDALLQPQYNMGSHASQLLRARMLQDDNIKTELSNLPNDAAREDLLNQRMSGLLAPKIFDGLRMDVNRPFGNGIDDNVDGVVDNFFIEAASPKPLWPSRHFDPKFGDNFPWDKNKQVIEEARKQNKPINQFHYSVSKNWDRKHRNWIWFDHDNDGFAKFADPDAFLARYHYARHLYVLMLLMKDKDRIIDFGNGVTTEAETHRNIAQWAVNAVDFRDADSIMTPFEFDLNPFNGWNVDGIIHSPQTPSLDDGHPERALVWGSERPELLITESLAFHDRRTEDLGDGDTFQDPELNTRHKKVGEADDDFDQRLLPNSGVFFELYNPWNSVYEGGFAKGSRSPAEFYQNLDAFGRDLPADEKGVRLDQLSYYPYDFDRLPHIKKGDRSPVWRMIIVRGVDKRRDPDAWDIANNPLTIERAIYFVNGHDDPNYKIKIPNADTADGNEDITERFFYRPNDRNNKNQRPKPLEPGHYAVIGSGTYNQITNKYPTYIGRLSEAEEDDKADVDFEDKEWKPHILLDTKKIELNPASNDVVHIPINYHYTRVIANNGVGNPEEKSLSITEPVFGYRDPDDPDENTLLPQGINNVGEPILSTTRDVPLDAEVTEDPITGNSRDALNVGGRMPGIDPVSKTKLRRGTTNDFAAVHLQRLANPLQPHDKETNPYRTIDTASIDVTAFNGVYKKLEVDPDTMEVLDPPKLVRPTPLCGGLKDTYNGMLVDRVRFNSLERGWSRPGVNMLWKHEPERDINKGPATLLNNSKQIFRYYINATLGQRNSSYPANNGPFPWLQWNNRPFVSQLELMMVPRSSSSQLLKDYSFRNNRNPYIRNGNQTNAAYGHLLNFLESGSGSTNFHRLFDYAEVQSYFTGAQTYLNPYVFQDDRANAADLPSLKGREELRPPFNRITNYRDPGRINMNTIFDRYVFEGLMGKHKGAIYADWNNSRRGYVPTQLIPPLNDDYPTFFANPIKPAGSGDMVPLTDLNPPAKPQKPLFSHDYDKPFENASRNPTFEYQSLQRLGNLTTGRSNVYSVWITVGYFEVRKSDGSLGVEVGIDEGRIKRHRAFYMIDRSIPVAFEPGENHNVDNAVILRRYID
jgi:hypothetical protein